ncbi:MAG: DUF4272 domain-containing protein [Methylobacillus sp.]|jgi:hypothetical protein|nr:DUF4272 domain-containing protein [Methylobacillus sp.]
MADDKDKPEVIATVQVPPFEGTLHGDQLLRKAWAEELLTERGIRVNPHLPCVESEAEITLRSPREVAERLLALTLVAVKGEGLEHDNMLQIVADYNAMDLFSPKERAFIENPDPDMNDRVQFSWRYEAAWVMFWALKFVDSPLDFAENICDVPLLCATVRDTADLAINGMQSANDILNETDLIYRCHWAVRQASLDGEPPPEGLNPGVVMERHQALNWLVRYDDADWDDVGTDT